MGTGSVEEQLIALLQRGASYDRKAALIALKQALRLAREAYRAQPTLITHEYMRRCLMDLATYARRINRQDVELDYLTKALPHAEALANDVDANLEDRQLLARVLGDLSVSLARQGAAPAAIEVARRAVAQCRQLHEKSNDRALSSTNLAVALEQLANALSAAQKSDGAFDILKRALEFREEAFRHSPGNFEAQEAWRGLLIRLARMKRHEDPAESKRFMAAGEKLLRDAVARGEGLARLHLATHLFESGGGHYSPTDRERNWTHLREAFELLDAERRTMRLPAYFENEYQMLASDLKNRSYKKAAPEAVRSGSPIPSLESLLESVYRAPTDDRLIEVLADALMEAGDPRGEFIRLQRGPKTTQSEKRVRELMRTSAEELLGPLADFVDLPATGAESLFRRGFPTCVALGDKRHSSSFGKTLAWATVEELTVRRFEYHPHLQQLHTLLGVHDAGTVKINELTRVVATEECLSNNPPFTRVRELGCLVWELENLHGLLAALKSRAWFKGVQTILVFNERPEAATEVFSRAPRVENVKFERALRSRFFPTGWVPPFNFMLSRKRELTLTLEPELKVDAARVQAALSDIEPSKVIVRGADGTSRARVKELEKAAKAVFGPHLVSCP